MYYCIVTCNKPLRSPRQASGKAPLWTSFFGSYREILSQPITFLRQPAFRYLAALFGGTYLAANTMATLAEAEPKTFGYPLVQSFGVFACNSSLSLWKDSAFARLFSTSAPKPVPWSALCSWWVRDFIGMSTIFVLPPLVAAYLHESQIVDSQKRAQTTAQVLLPLAIQPIVGPFHLLGYVLYNQSDAPWAARLATMRKELFGTIVMRWIRVFPPFSIGTVVNSKLRTALKPAKRETHMRKRELTHNL